MGIKIEYLTQVSVTLKQEKGSDTVLIEARGLGHTYSAKLRKGDTARCAGDLVATLLKAHQPTG